MNKSLVALALFLLAFIPGWAGAQTKLYVTGAGRLYPIALPQLCLRGEGTAAKEIPEVLARDLDLSGYFDVLNPNTFIESPGSCKGNEEFAYSDWSVIGAEGLVRGVVESSGGKIRAQLYLHDVQVNRVVLGKEYQADATQARLLAHRFANEIVKFFTGEAGVFGSQIVFSGKMGRFKELYVMDMDGSNIHQITNDKSLNMASSWNPVGDLILYTTYIRRVPELFLLDPYARKGRQISHDETLELGGKFSRDGKTVLLSRSTGAQADLVIMGLDGQVLRNLTRGTGSINVSPDWSPDNSQIVFCSDRSGGPQIYTMNASGGDVKRISFVASKYCTSSAWSPKGDKIVFVCQSDGGYQLFVSNPDGSNPQQITNGGRNEDPSWAPDGRYIVFATTAYSRGNYNLALIRSDGNGMRALTNSPSSDVDPAWSPVVP